MRAARLTYFSLRILRWLFWIAFFALTGYVFIYRDDLLTGFGHLPLWVEFGIYGLSNAAVFAGMLELMMRERAGLPRPHSPRSDASLVTADNVR